MVVLPEALLESQHGRHGVAQIGNPNIMGIEYV
jgi:flagellum-specific peptidoglycan hydrolase FlgJ